MVSWFNVSQKGMIIFLGQKFKKSKQTIYKIDFPGSQVVKVLYSTAGGMGLIPGQGAMGTSWVVQW